MKMSFWQSLKTFTMLAVFAALLVPATSNAQDEVEKAERTSAAKIKQGYATRAASLSKASAAKLKTAQADLGKIQGATFEVNATEALDRNESELLGIKGSDAKPPTQAEMDAQEKETKQLRIQHANEIQGGVESGGGPVGAPASYYFAGTSVKNQGGCGSCWAFAAAGAWEHSYKKFYGGVKNLSEQELLACGKTCGGTDAGSCNGGWSDRALDHIKCRKAPTEAAYPYNIAQGNNCLAKPKVYGSYSWGSLYASASLKDYLVTYGALVVYMRAGLNSFYAYSGGIYNGYPNTSWGDIDHAVVLVGYNNAGGYWIIKNSWGTGWGVNGYAYIKYGHCNIGGYAYYTYPMK